jgi:hypothetical protein
MKKNIFYLFLIFTSMTSFTQDAPKLDFFRELNVKLDPALNIGLSKGRED